LAGNPKGIENYLTVFNDNVERHETTITTDDTPSEASRDLVSGRQSNGTTNPQRSHSKAKASQ
jgi:hypothetical protein